MARAVTHGDAGAPKTRRELRLRVCECLEATARADLDRSQM
jgi:hypothetical protein